METLSCLICICFYVLIVDANCLHLKILVSKNLSGRSMPQVKLTPALAPAKQNSSDLQLAPNYDFAIVSGIASHHRHLA